MAADTLLSVVTSSVTGTGQNGSAAISVAAPLPVVPAGVVSAETGTEAKPEETKPVALEPLFVRPLVAIEQGRNDSNPQWSPQGTLIAFERSVGDKREIHITLPDGTPVQTVYSLLSSGGEQR